MPYKSEAQRRYFNANREKLEAEGVDVDEWNKSSKGKKMPEKKSAIQELAEKAAGKRGLWDNIHAKRKRGEKPAKPGDKDYPDAKSWKKTTKEAAAIKALVLEKIAKGRCWDGYEPVPGKDAYSDDSCRKIGSKKKKSEKKAEALKALVLEKIAKSPAWQREEGKSESGGLNAKGRASLKAQGQDIKAPVTQKNPKGKAKGRKASFCARMGGMKKKLTSEKTRNDPDSRINKSLRKWNC